MKEKIILVGGGGHCLSCIDVIESEGKFEIVGIVDLQENIGKMILGYKVIGTDKDLETLKVLASNILITIGQIKNPNQRMNKFIEIKKMGFNFPTIISPRAYVSKHSKLGEGTIVMHDALVVAGVEVGRNCIINSKALIEHDSIIEDFCHISTASVINGNCRIGTKTFIGSNSVLKESVIVASESIIAAGSFYKGNT